ncbi:hypothetical protein ACJW30_07G041700 [Castanea mollissima]
MQKVISLTRPITEEAITNLYCRTLPRSLAIADLGCSSGPNTLFVVSELIKVVDKLRKKLGHESIEYQVYCQASQKRMSCQMGPGAGPCLFSGTPGSFYGRLLPSNSLHFVHSSYSLQWLSQVLEGLDNNKGIIYMECTSPPNVLRAYYEQYQRDFSMFLKCCAEKLVVGEGMVLNFLGRRMKIEVLKEGNFSIDRLEVFAIKWNDFDNEFNASNAFSDDGYKVAKYMRVVVESMLVSHFGDTIIDEVFLRYGKIIADHISKENCQFINVSISITKIG